MIRIFLQLCILVFLFGCQENNENNTTEIITDSYFFQKNSFNVNLYNCNQPQNSINPTYFKSEDFKAFVKFSEISEKDTSIEDCEHRYFILDELTSATETLLTSSFFMEISSCTSLMNQNDLTDSLNTYLDEIRTRNVEVWSALSPVQNNSFIWVNVWPSELYRDEFLKIWLSTSTSGNLALELRKSAMCNVPETYAFIK